ncbi:MAG: AMP-binding protein [Polyangiaceae bacterium]|nr:AMP-binding protein [Polyangiaceae bacterium]
MGSPLVDRLLSVASTSRAIIQDDSVQRPYADVLGRALRVRGALCAGAASLDGERVALLASPGAPWIEAFLGVVLAGGVALPLSPLYPPSELAWFLADAGARRLLVSGDLAGLAAPLAAGREILRVEELGDRAASRESAAADLDADATAVLLYTSGTTGRPKGARLTHRNLATQAALLRDAWAVTEGDALLHALPLHHLHGLGISLLTALTAGSSVRMLPRFDAARVAAEIARGAATTLMAVPTMYQRLFEHVDRAPGRAAFEAGARALRLATSGSAALPVTLAERWRDLTGAIPLERFGMTEIGVGMSNPLDRSARRAGWVGPPLPTVEARIVGEAGEEAARGPGELWIRGPSVFPGYHGRDEATAAAFKDGWFRTGDVAERAEDGYVRLLGRTSVDILKSGGYKLSALEIEEALREHAAIAEVAVVGVPDEAWGDRVVAVVVPAPGREAECATGPLRAWAKERLAAYKAPREVIAVPSLPRNAIGKVVKPDLVQAIVRGTLRKSPHA